MHLKFTTQDTKLKKPPRNGCALFQEENWHRIKEGAPSLSGKDVYQKAQEKWKELSPEEQRVCSES